MTKDERLEQIDQGVARLDRRLDQVFATLRDMAEGWTILASQIGDIHEACCGERPPSELAEALRDLARAIDRQGQRIEALIERTPKFPTWEFHSTATPQSKLRPDEG